jgi:hypothetical protein
MVTFWLISISVGKLIFLTQTRPYISFAINMLNKFSHKPQILHLDATKHLFCYIKGVVDLGICYQGKEVNILIGFFNTDWVGDLQDRKSTKSITN